jgi:ribose transport system ATP-binding protein/rhamnose transport system ATP-binding protein
MKHSGVSEVLSIKGLTKSYAAVRALSNVSFSLQPGEVRAICGENGAGKSTLVKVLMGIVVPDGGTISIAGAHHEIRDSRHAQSLGLGLVAQELSLAPHLSILDNVWLGCAEVSFFHRRASLRERAREALTILGAGNWDLDRSVGSLTIGQCQIVEIARLLARKTRILILDEPTATLSDIEIARLMQVLRTMREQGHSIIYVSHRLGEVFNLCDTVTVLRNGEHIVTQPVGQLTRDSLIALMLGRPSEELYPKREKAAAEHRGGLRVSNLGVPGAVEDVTLDVPRGKIVCIAGQLGSGATAVIRALAGLVGGTGGVSIDGRPLQLGSVAAAVANDIIFVTDDRHGEGIYLGLPVMDNLVATRLAECGRLGLISWAKLRKVARWVAEQVSIPFTHLELSARNLSGGNQQKLLFARGVGRSRPGLLIMNEPTRGIDVGARAEIYRLMRRLCQDGYVLLMTSSDLEEVVGLADIVFTFYRGRLISRYEGEAITMTSILRDIASPDVWEGMAA